MMAALLRAFPDREAAFVAEAEVAETGTKAPADVVTAWVEGLGMLAPGVRSRSAPPGRPRKSSPRLTSRRRL